jgi:hypothetical protein
MGTRYELQGRTADYTSGWHPEVVAQYPEFTSFNTMQEAQEALRDQVERFGWDEDDLRIVEIEEDGD